MYDTIVFDTAGGTAQALDAGAGGAVVAALGAHATRRRASHIVPAHPVLAAAFRLLRRAGGDAGRIAAWTRRWPCRWCVDLGPSGGPVLGPFATRSDAVAAEVAYLKRRILLEEQHHGRRPLP